jgi:maltooligosyltrehalose trehalohydrolase
MPELEDGFSTGSRLSIGAIPHPRGTQFRIWAPLAHEVDVVLEGNDLRYPLGAEEDGYFSGLLKEACVDRRYRFSLDGGEAFPDPASRYQPEGPHGASQIIDPGSYVWSEAEMHWPGVSIEGQVLYELHIGTLTPQGTFLSALHEFSRLQDLGITVLECMPLAEFSGNVGWGYDGVDLFAPFHRYGHPDDLRRMIDAAHQRGLGVILDVVYNHLGPDGNYLGKYSNHYFSDKNTEWGNAINFDGEHSKPVRDFFLANVAHWISEYHFDGLRLDATQSIHDTGSHGTHIIAEIGQCVRASANGRKTIVLAENEPQDSRLICSVDQNGYGLDAVWNDDFHHSAVVAVTGRREAYFSDHLGQPQEFISAAKYGYLYQGQYYSWQQHPRGTSSLSCDAKAFITFLENHDQIANFGRSQRMRLLSSPSRYRAMTALWLLIPGTPMFFQGQEYGAQTPFHYFAGHTGELAAAVTRGRGSFMLQFGTQDTPEMKNCVANPEDPETFRQSVLDPSEQERHLEIVQLHTDLLALRRTDSVLSRNDCRIDGAVLGQSCFVLRYLTSSREDRLLLVNFGVGLDLPHLPEPLTAPPACCEWMVQWSSEWPKYGGCGSYAPDRFGPWHVTGESTQLLASVKSSVPFSPESPKSGLTDSAPN